jgi:hypothetical protein
VLSYVAGSEPSLRLLPDAAHSSKCNKAGNEGLTGPPIAHICSPLIGSVTLAAQLEPKILISTNVDASSGSKFAKVNESRTTSSGLVLMMPVGSPGESSSQFVIELSHPVYVIAPPDSNVCVNGCPVKLPPVQWRFAGGRR